MVLRKDDGSFELAVFVSVANVLDKVLHQLKNAIGLPDISPRDIT